MQGYNPYGDPMAAEARLQELTPEQQQQLELLTPDQRQAFMALLMRDFGGEISDAESAMSRADALRFNQRAQGRGVGNVYVAANPLEHIADLLRHKRGSEEYEVAQQARDTARSDSADLRRQVAERLISRSDALRGMGY